MFVSAALNRTPAGGRPQSDVEKFSDRFVPRTVSPSSFTVKTVTFYCPTRDLLNDSVDHVDTCSWCAQVAGWVRRSREKRSDDDEHDLTVQSREMLALPAVVRG